MNRRVDHPPALRSRPRPGSTRSTKMGEPLFSDPIEIAAAYLFYICRNHPFLDGNKRTALATGLVFLSENGLLPEEDLDAGAWESLTIAVASGELDRPQATQRLRRLVPKRRRP